MTKDNTSPFPTSAQIDRMKQDGTLPAKPAEHAHQKVEETTIDNGVEESFPASDPVSVSITKLVGPAE